MAWYLDTRGFILKMIQWHIHAGSWSLVNYWREACMRPFIRCSWILIRLAVGLTECLGLDGDRCIRMIPRHLGCRLSSGNTQKWWRHSNPIYCNQFVNFFTLTGGGDAKTFMWWKITVCTFNIQAIDTWWLQQRTHGSQWSLANWHVTEV